MTVLDQIDGLIFHFKNINSFTSAVSTLVTLVGVFVVLLCVVKLLLAAQQGFLLYVVSQSASCGSTQATVKKYGQWALITGGANGIGQSMARELARRGHSIIVLDVDGENLAHTKSLLEREPNVGQVETIQADLSDSSLKNYVELEQQLKLDSREVGILVNCAGVATSKLMKYGRFEWEAIRRTVNVNVLGTALMTRLLLPQMAARRRGLILNLSSVLANMGSVYSGVYGPTKAFVSEFSCALEQEYSRTHNVDVVCLTPSAVRTRMLTAFGQNALPSSIMVSPDYFARSALNALGSGIKCYSGCWMHGIWSLMVALIRNLGLLPLTYRLLMGIPSPQRSPVKKG